MTEKFSELKNYYDHEWAIEVQEKHWPILAPFLDDAPFCINPLTFEQIMEEDKSS